MTTDLYRAFWRWHFYAGLLVLPFLAWLAVTGGLYLFKAEIERLIYDDWIVLDQRRPALAASAVIAATEAATAAEVTQVEVPAATGEAWRLRVQGKDGARTAFVDPGTGQVLGTVTAGGVMKTVRDLHSLAITGTLGNALIEIAAGWAIVLVVTGLVLWWPRSGERAVALRGSPRRRRFWRDLHATTGFLAGGIILFLAVTGMPWSLFWGDTVQGMVAQQGSGRPKAPGPAPWELEHAGQGDAHGAAHASREALPWSLQDAAQPHARGDGDVGPDRVLRIAAQAGLARPYTLIIPQAGGQPYSISRAAHAAHQARAIYVEPASGRVLQDAGYAQFGKGAKLIEWGIATHQGQQYGEPNRWVMLLGCVALLLLCVSAPVLWWKRRVQGRLRPPPEPKDKGAGVKAALAAAAVGLMFPLTGLTMLLVMVGDRMVVRARLAH